LPHLNSAPVIRVLALMEAASVIGPAKNLIHFCRWTRTPDAAAFGLNMEISVATFCRPPDGSNNNDFVRALRAEQIPAWPIEEKHRFDPGVVCRLAALARHLDPHIVQTHMVKSHCLFKAAGMCRTRKWMAFQHGYTATDLKGRLYNQMDRWSLRSADRVIAVCRAFVPRLLAYGVQRERVRILHNSTGPAATVDRDEVTQLRNRLGLDPRDKVVLSIGRLSREKAHGDLIQALAHLQSLDPRIQWKAVVVGKGPELPNLERMTSRLGLDGRVVFAGFHTNMAPFYAIADVFALPSLSEGSPNVLLEAMAAGVPVAATHTGGIPEIVTGDKHALLVPVGDTRALGAALGRLLSDRPLRERLASCARMRVRDAFSPERYVHSLAGFYMDVLALPSHAGLGHSSPV
jgi:glycosyltransferase involved in cell wall biosynthesis